MAPPSVADDCFLLSGPTMVRDWLKVNHRKQLALLDKFLLELRLGRLISESTSSATTPTTSQQQSVTDRLMVTHRTVELLRHIIGSTRWRNAAQLLCLLRGVGRELHGAGGFREPAIGNVVRRIMAAVREEALSEDAALGGGAGGGERRDASSGTAAGGRLSLESVLWALPQHVRTAKRSLGATGDHMRQESFASEADLETEYPSIYYTSRPDLKQSVMEAIQEIMTDLEDLHRNINEQATSHIHADEVILTYGRSKTIELFLKAAAAKKRKFSVVVCEDAPRHGGQGMAEALAQAGIETLVINDSAMFAMMARVNKVLLPAHAVLANGGLIASSGCNLVALAAHHNSIPVVCVTGLFKLCPMYPHEGQDTLNDLVSPNSIMEYAQMNDPLMADVELVNPVHDYIKPEHVNLYITNVGSFQPSFIYRLLAEYYHIDDWESFE